MKKMIEPFVVFVLTFLLVGVGFLCYLAYRLVEETVTVIDRTWGAAFYQVIGAAALFAVVLVLSGSAIYVVNALGAKARRIYARDGLFPVIDQGSGQFANLNERGAQTLAALGGAAGRVSAPTVGRVIDMHYRQPEPTALPEPAPVEALHFPARAEVYSAAFPRELALPVGIGGDGQPVALPLRNLGNVLIAGLPGSGKSELLASMLAGLLRQDATGRRVQVATVDTKLVTFGNMPPLAALYAPPALEIEDAHALVWGLVEEVRRRFQLLQAAGVRSIEEYQARTGETLPYLVTVIDELADMTADHDRRRAAGFNGAAMEIGRKGRAAGVSLVMATQRPSADVIPSSLRNLAGAAVAFRLARADDSRLVLDTPGAEGLPATPGRCLVRHRETVQAQAYFAGLEGGRFDQFCAALPAPGWPVRETGIPAQPSPQPGIPVGIPVFGTEQTGDYTLEQVAHIRQRHAALGSLKAVQREIYGQEGGYWFYRIRDAVEG